jgi:short-subunit dehydrogenase
MPNAVVVGASSGIGRAVAGELAAAGYDVGVTARRTDRLREVAESLPGQSYITTMDVTEPEEARDRLERTVDAMGGLDVLVLSAGIGPFNRELAWAPDADTVATNVAGFAALATLGMQTFADTGGGQLVGFSSVAALFGNGTAPAYNASKAFDSRYLEGLRYWAAGREADVTVTDVKLGFVDTDLAKGDLQFWTVSPETAAAGIARAIRREREHVYVPRRWRLVGSLLSVLPRGAIERLFT